MPKPRLMYEILIPCNYNSGKPVRTRHHKHWDKVVQKIAGGLTIYKPAQGQWRDSDNDVLYKDRLIPVRIACTDKQINQIAEFTLRHYDQLAVMVYVVSEQVIIFTNEQKRQNQTPDRIIGKEQECPSCV